MFTVKLYKSSDDGENSHSISCPHYSVYKRSNGNMTITVYRTMTYEHGVEWQVSTEDRDFDTCFIENETGKTIDCYKAGLG